MVSHTPSSNSFAYKLLGGKPVTEITFRLPAIRTEEITIGKRKVLSFTALTPLDENRTAIRQLFFTDHPTFRLLSPFRGCGYASQMVLCAKESLDKIKFDWRGFYQSRQSPHFALAELNRADRESMR